MRCSVRFGNCYTLEECGVLWRFALPSERMRLLLDLNFGGAQAEILNLLPEHRTGTETTALRSKTGVIGRRLVWPETRALAATEFQRIPADRQGIANSWNQLLVSATKRPTLGGSVSSGSASRDHPSFARSPTARWRLCTSHAGRARPPMTTSSTSTPAQTGTRWSRQGGRSPRYRAGAASAAPDGPVAAANLRRVGNDRHDPADVAGRQRSEPDHCGIIAATGKSRTTVYRYRPEPVPVSNAPA